MYTVLLNWTRARAWTGHVEPCYGHGSNWCINVYPFRSQEVLKLRDKWEKWVTPRRAAWQFDWMGTPSWENSSTIRQHLWISLFRPAFLSLFQLSPPIFLIISSCCPHVTHSPVLKSTDSVLRIRLHIIRYPKKIKCGRSVETLIQFIGQKHTYGYPCWTNALLNLDI